MKKALLLLALVQGITLSALAQTATSADATKNRAEVKSEAKTANQSGELNKGGDAGVTLPSAPSVKARADVKTDTKTAAKSGELKGGDIAPGETAAQTKNSSAMSDGKSRSDVEANAKVANKKGELHQNGDIGVQPVPVVKKSHMKKAGKIAEVAPQIRTVV